MAPRDNVVVHKRKTSVTNCKASDVSGDVIADVHGHKWRLGKSVGVGAFGEIFLASNDLAKPVSANTSFIVKMEPHTSGPLFVERNFYLRAARPESIESWKGRRPLGIPSIVTFGSCTRRGVRMRFIVMAKFGPSVESMLVKRNHKFHVKTAFTIGLYVVDALEYVHSRGYIHADLKAANLVLSESPESAPVFLIDYGLVARFQSSDSSHSQFVMDARVANAGTLEFSSRDSHRGVICRRSDLESLGYCLVTWLGGRLPWSDCLSQPDLVEGAKDDAMADIPQFLYSAFQTERYPTALVEYFKYIVTLEFASKPNYQHVRKILRSGIVRSGFRSDYKLTFDSHAKQSRKTTKRIAERENIGPPMKLRRTDGGHARKPCAEYNEISGRVTRNVDKGANQSLDDFDWATVLAGDPEQIIRQYRKKTEKMTDRAPPPRISPVEQFNPTPAMLRIMQKKLSSDSARKSPSPVGMRGGSPLTYAMLEVLAQRQPVKRALRSSTRRS